MATSEKNKTLYTAGDNGKKGQLYELLKDVRPVDTGAEIQAETKEVVDDGYLSKRKEFQEKIRNEFSRLFASVKEDKDFSKAYRGTDEQKSIKFERDIEKLIDSYWQILASDNFPELKSENREFEKSILNFCQNKLDSKPLSGRTIESLIRKKCGEKLTEIEEKRAEGIVEPQDIGGDDSKKAGGEPMPASGPENGGKKVENMNYGKFMEDLQNIDKDKLVDFLKSSGSFKNKDGTVYYFEPGQLEKVQKALKGEVKLENSDLPGFLKDKISEDNYLIKKPEIKRPAETHEKFKERLEGIKDEKSLLDYLGAVEKYRKVNPQNANDAANYYLEPQYLEKVKKVFKGELPLEAIGNHPDVSGKVEEILNLSKKKESQDGGIIRDQLKADVAEVAPRTYGKGIYANGSVPEDAREEYNKTRNVKNLEKNGGEKTDIRENGRIEEIVEDFSNKIINLEKISIKGNKSSILAKGNGIGGALMGNKIKVGEQIILSMGHTSPVKSIKREADGSYIIETETSFYKMSTFEMPDYLKKEKEESKKRVERADEQQGHGVDKRKMEDVERERAQAAQNNVIDKTESDYQKFSREMEENPPLASMEEVEKKRQSYADREIKSKESDKEKFGREQDERQENIERLQKETEEARMKYAGKDYETTNVLSRIKKFLGVKMESKSVDTVSAYYNDYRVKLTELLDLRLEDLKSRNLGKEELRREMGGLIKYFNLDEKLNLFEARTNARVVAREGKFGEKFIKYGARIINGYRKLNWKYKMAISGTLLATGAGATVLGVFRAFSGIATGVGTAGTIEATSRARMKRKAEKGKEELLEELEKEEDKYTILTKKLEEEISGYDKSLKTEKIKARNRKLWGALVGVFVGSGAASTIAKELGATSWLQGKLGLPTHHLGSSPASGNLEYAGIKAPEVTPDATSFDIPVAAKGSSIDGAVAHYLNDHPDLIEKYQQLNGGKSFKSGQIAHRMALEWAKNKPEFANGPPSLIHEGTRIEINPENLKIINVDDPKGLGYLPESNPPDVSSPEINAETPSSGIASGEGVPETHLADVVSPEAMPNSPSPMHFYEIPKDYAGAVKYNLIELTNNNPDVWKSIQNLKVEEVLKNADLKKIVLGLETNYVNSIGWEAHHYLNESTRDWVDRISKLAVERSHNVSIKI